MSCHNDNKNSQGDRNHSPIKHILHMALCCGLPIIVIGLLPFIAKFSPSAGTWLGKIAPFLCPIMMLTMLPMMFSRNKKGSCCDEKEENHDMIKPIE